MSYQKITGPLMANSHPGSYCGQDAYTDMFITEDKNGLLYRERSGTSALSIRNGGCAELYGRPTESIEGGGITWIQ